MSLRKWQLKYYLAGAAILPAAPLLYLQGQWTRWRIGVLPEAAGPNEGIAGDDLGGEPERLLVIGESTVAGLGARTHEFALAGQFAARLSRRRQRPIEWLAIGRNGYTARRTINELFPLIPKGRFDHILLGLGGNDVLKLSSPAKWRHDLSELLAILRERYPDADVFMTNCPMIVASPAIPQPIKSILWELSKMHDRSARELAGQIERFYYYHQPREFTVEGFFADGIHPSEQGYADWSEAMIKFFESHYKW